MSPGIRENYKESSVFYGAFHTHYSSKLNLNIIYSLVKHSYLRGMNTRLKNVNPTYNAQSLLVFRNGYPYLNRNPGLILVFS